MKGNRLILRCFYTSHQIFCLQVEVNDGSGGNGAYDMPSESHDVVNSDILAARQVNSFMSHDFATEIF